MICIGKSSKDGESLVLIPWGRGREVSSLWEFLIMGVNCVFFSWMTLPWRFWGKAKRRIDGISWTWFWRKCSTVWSPRPLSGQSGTMHLHLLRQSLEKISYDTYCCKMAERLPSWRKTSINTFVSEYYFYITNILKWSKWSQLKNEVNQLKIRYKDTLIEVQGNLSNLTCTGKVSWCRNRQGCRIKQSQTHTEWSKGC